MRGKWLIEKLKKEKGKGVCYIFFYFNFKVFIVHDFVIYISNSFSVIFVLAFCYWKKWRWGLILYTVLGKQVVTFLIM